MPDLPATEFTAVVSGDGALVPPDDVRAALVPGARVHVRVAETPSAESAAPEVVQAALDRLGSHLHYDGPPIPVEKLSMEAYDYRDAHPDDDVTRLR